MDDSNTELQHTNKVDYLVPEGNQSSTDAVAFKAQIEQPLGAAPKIKPALKERTAAVWANGKERAIQALSKFRRPKEPDEYALELARAEKQEREIKEQQEIQQVRWRLEQETRERNKVNKPDEGAKYFAVDVKVEQETEVVYDLPSIDHFPSPAQEIAREDVEGLQEIRDQLDTFIKDNEHNPDFIAATIRALSQSKKPKKGAHHSEFQRPYLSPTVVVDPGSVWNTQELRAMSLQVRARERAIAQKANEILEQSDVNNPPAWQRELQYELNTLDQMREPNITIVDLEKANKEVEEIGTQDMLLYHGTTTEAFLDMLESGGLLCRKKQEEKLGRNRFATSENKRSDQEMQNVSFAVNKANWGYTRSPGTNGDSRFLGPAEYTWIVTDGGFQIKNQQNKFLYSDGLLLYGSDVQEGFGLDFQDSPTCFMMPQERVDIVKKRMQNDSRFTPEDIEFFERKTVVIPQEQIPKEGEKIDFRIPDDTLSLIKEKFAETPYDVPQRKGYIVPSGELGEYQSGTKVMTYCWAEAAIH